MKSNLLWARVMVLLCSLSLCHFSLAGSSSSATEEPSAMAMTADTLLVRPAMLGVTVLGTGVWLVSLPFTLASGSTKSSAETLMLEPLKTTFWRCLGCTTPGYQKD